MRLDENEQSEVLKRKWNYPLSEANGDLTLADNETQASNLKLFFIPRLNLEIYSEL